MAVVLFACGDLFTTVNAYVVSCDVDARNGRGAMQFSENIADAMVFRDVGHALWYWKRQSTVVPLRPDGKPNRPLSAFTVEVREVRVDTTGPF